MPAPSKRVIVLWLPDWPVTAALSATTDTGQAVAPGIGADPTVVPGIGAGPVAVIDRGRVLACSAPARASAVHRGLRLREAQARCPSLITLPYDPVADTRAFEPVLAAVEQLMPGVQPIRPGLCALGARGPARFYGSEADAAEAMRRRLGDIGIPACRIGIADGVFSAEQAARSGGSEPVIIIPGGEDETAGFLSSLPIGVLEAPELGTLLSRLGVRTLGDFARLDQTLVRDRFGGLGAHAHALASGAVTDLTPREAARDLDVVVDFEPPLSSVDQVAFALRTASERFIGQVNSLSRLCTALRVSIRTETGSVSERCWLHPRWFTAPDVVDRVRWQLQGSSGGPHGLDSPVSRVEIGPAETDAAGDHEEGLWDFAPDERIHHGLSRVQGMLGHGAVVTGLLAGGRMLAARQRTVPWGDREPPGATAEHVRPWPGRLPAPLPTRLYDPPVTAGVLGADGKTVRLDDRGRLTAPPARMSVQVPDREGAPVRAETHGRRPSPSGLRHRDETVTWSVTAWAGPWPVDEQWWDARAGHRVHRFQLVDERGDAWLMLLTDEGWQAEARYD